MISKKLLRRVLLLMGCILPHLLFAQTNVSGKITDTEGKPVVGATVAVKGQTTGVAADAEGVFSI